jgi:hypothetical protein
MLKPIRTPMIVLALAALLALPVLAFAQEGTPVTPTQRSITVSGTGQASGAPDIAYITLGSEATDPNPSNVFNSVNTTIRAVRAALAGLNIAEADIQTSSFNMWAQDEYDASGGRTGNRVYYAQNILTIKVRDIAVTGEVIRVAVDAGANVIQGLMFGLSDPNALMSQARTAAIADAQARAQQLAQALGVTVGEVILVTEGTVPSNVPLPNVRGQMADAVVSAQVAPGSLSVQVDVTVTFAIGS